MQSNLVTRTFTFISLLFVMLKTEYLVLPSWRKPRVLRNIFLVAKHLQI